MPAEQPALRAEQTLVWAKGCRHIAVASQEITHLFGRRPLIHERRARDAQHARRKLAHRRCRLRAGGGGRTLPSQSKLQRQRLCDPEQCYGMEPMDCSASALKKLTDDERLCGASTVPLRQECHSRRPVTLRAAIDSDKRAWATREMVS